MQIVLSPLEAMASMVSSVIFFFISFVSGSIWPSEFIIKEHLEWKEKIYQNNIFKKRQQIINLLLQNYF